MRICILPMHFDPDMGGGGAVYSDLIYELAERGHHVTVICPIAFYPEFKDKEQQNGFRIVHKQAKNLDIFRYGFRIPKNPNSLFDRALFELTLFLSMLRALPKFAKQDVVMTYVPYFAPLVIGLLGTKLFRVPGWLNVQDIMSDAAEATGFKGGRRFFRLFRWVEQRIFAGFALWSSISPRMIESLAKRNSADRPIVFFPNWADQRLLDALEAGAVATSASSDSSDVQDRKLRILYAGNIGAKQHLAQALGVLRRCDVDFECRVFGDGSKVQTVKDLLAEAGDPRFVVGPFLSLEDFAHQLLWADLFLVTEQAGVGGSFFPSKTVSAFAAGCPVLAIADAASPLGAEIDGSGAGARLEWDGLAVALPQFLERVRKDRNLLQSMSAAATARGRCYERKALVDKFEKHMQDLMARRAVRGFDPLLSDGADQPKGA